MADHDHDGARLELPPDEMRRLGCANAAMRCAAELAAGAASAGAAS